MTYINEKIEIFLIFLIFHIKYIILNMLRIATKFFTGNNFKFATAVQKSTNSKSTSSGDLTYYKDGQLVTRSAIVLKEKQDIEAYVIKIIQNYPRTTFKNGKLSRL